MKKLVIAGLLSVLTTQTAVAQDFRFNEMEYSPKQTSFQLFAPANAKAPRVRIYKEGIGGKAVKTVKMTLRDGLWTATVKGDLMGKFYTFDIGRGETPGVFATAVGVNGRRGAIIDRKATNPEGWDSDRRLVCKSPADMIVYEMHHRDFSIARADAKYPGKFLALTEPWAISHLKELGVTAVHLLPSYDFGSVDETHLDKPQYNWGYDPVNYNVPDGSYSTDPYRPEVRISEFKQMVQALHKAGIAVILDVVYNHTYDIDHSNFQLTYPDYYYRKTAAVPAASPSGSSSSVPAPVSPAPVPDGSPSGYSNGSGCGNETASERPMMRRFMIESVKHWYNEYHIDGFRFDLMGVHDIETMNAIRQALDGIAPGIFIYGEGWSAGQCALPTAQLGVKANIPQMPGIAAFSDEIRDALRGPFSDDTKPGILGWNATEDQAASLTESLKFGIVGCISHPQVDMTKVNYSQEPWAVEPTQMMSYVSCHDDMCLVDRLKASIPGITQDELIRLDLLAQTAVFTSQGVPFMLSGEELLRTKQGVHNSFESPDSINHLDWTNKLRYPQVFQYYKNLIQLRKRYPHFRLGNADLVRKSVQFLEAPKGVVAYRITATRGHFVDSVIVVLNFTRQEQSVAIPEGNYFVLATAGVIDLNGIDRINGSQVAVAPQSALIIQN